MGKTGYLQLENGHVYEGVSFGWQADVKGEVVFNTGMVGYPEGLTDPSYCGQIVVLTYPLIGNYGFPPQEIKRHISDYLESDHAQIQGLVVSSYIDAKSHWQAQETLGEWLQQQKIPALCAIDTRTLTKTLREAGVMNGILSFQPPLKKGVFFRDINRENLVSSVSCKKPIVYGSGKYKILLVDCGLKANQIRILLKQNSTVIRIPWDFNPFKEKKYEDFDGVMISNGPGDPKMVSQTIEFIQEVLKRKIPILGVCLGNQILALAAGANTYKMKYGHRSQNQPVTNFKNGRCYVTTQNHGFAVDATTLPPGWEPWFTNLNDKTNEGIRHTKYPFFSTQFHPEAAPGPTDTEWVFEYFISQIKK